MYCERPPHSVGRVGPVSPGVSVAGKYLRTCPPQDHDVGPSRKQAVLASAAMATALLDSVSLPLYPSVTLEPTGFMNYRLLAPGSSGPMLPWNKKHGGGIKGDGREFQVHLEIPPSV